MIFLIINFKNVCFLFGKISEQRKAKTNTRPGKLTDEVKEKLNKRKTQWRQNAKHMT